MGFIPENVIVNLKKEIAASGGAAIEDLTTRVQTLETTVGDETGGLVKDVDDLETVVGDSTSGLVKDVDDLETVVGDNSSGLVKNVNDINEDVYIKAGDSLSLYVDNASYGGFITAGAAEIYITIPLPEKIKTTLEATVSVTGNLYVRGVGGFIINNEDASNLNISVRSVANNLLVILIKNTDSAAFSATNNTPVSLMFATNTSVTATFSASTREEDPEDNNDLK